MTEQASDLPRPGDAADTPIRRAGSIRRTSSIEWHFPEGRDGPIAFSGRARDALTAREGEAPEILVEDRLELLVDAKRQIQSLSTEPPLPADIALVGANAMFGFRGRLRPLFDDPALAARPLALLLDDMVGCNIISTWVWTKWIEDREELFAYAGDASVLVGACQTYVAGSTPLTNNSFLFKHDPVVPLGRADDPHAFHALRPDEPKTMRRVRRIDLWREGGAWVIDAMVQDSGVVPDGRGGSTRGAVHEYGLRARADADSGELREVVVRTGALPHSECLGAPASVQALIGLPLPQLRADVLTRLRGAAGCTHLNDAMRALAEVPTLADSLP